MGFSFAERRVSLEEEGILISGWSMRNIITPKKKDRKHVSSEDRVQNATLAAPDWTKEEERALLWKLDLRVLLPCCIIYFLAYLDRGNLGNVKILGAGTPASLENSLHMVALYTVRVYNAAKTMEAYNVATATRKGIAMTGLWVLTDSVFAIKMKRDFNMDVGLRYNKTTTLEAHR
ncbi:hypothetical protein V502_03000 [Pseudogymnoascus sp. VKM F-4520 (FW-2644)]|nr:hypothetical protein V502_03000 [Pseudogymnoascus sp. VKM F-4520 (FW-2644)]